VSDGGGERLVGSVSDAARAASSAAATLYHPSRRACNGPLPAAQCIQWCCLGHCNTVAVSRHAPPVAGGGASGRAARAAAALRRTALPCCRSHSIDIIHKYNTLYLCLPGPTHYVYSIAVRNCIVCLRASGDCNLTRNFCGILYVLLWMNANVE
jgi:hypothetical protein